MEGLVAEGARVWLSEATGERALRHTWELIELDGQLIGANTIIPNSLVRAVLERRLIPGFDDVTTIRAEQRFAGNHRVDFLLERPDGQHYVEVKNCHLVYPDGLGYFPDSTSERATAHVEALEKLVKQGTRATVLFTLQRADASGLRPSALHDPAFAAALRKAAAEGLEARALRFTPSLHGLTFDREVPVDLSDYALDPVRTFGEALCPTSGWERKDGKTAGQRLPVAKVKRAKTRSTTRKSSAR
jgi:sugar fermentation stimulation protein A